MKLKLNFFTAIFFFIILTLVLGIIFKITEINAFYIATIISSIPIFLYGVITILFAWVINPIKKLIDKIKK